MGYSKKGKVNWKERRLIKETNCFYIKYIQIYEDYTRQKTQTRGELQRSEAALFAWGRHVDMQWLFTASLNTGNNGNQIMFSYSRLKPKICYGFFLHKKGINLCNLLLKYSPMPKI